MVWTWAEEVLQCSSEEVQETGCMVGVGWKSIGRSNQRGHGAA